MFSLRTYSMSEKKSILYICYDGLMEPLGQSQVFEYLRDLAVSPDLKFTLVTFEKKADWKNRGNRNMAYRQV